MAAIVLFALGLADTFSCVACEVDINDPPEEFARVYRETAEGTRLGAYLTLLGTFFFLGFVSYLRKELQEAEGEGGWLSSMAYGGGLVAAAVALIRAALGIASAVAGDNEATAEVARTLYVLAFEFDFTFAAPMAAVVAATSVVILRHHWMPWPIGLLGIPVVVFVLLPLAPGFGTAIAISWLLLPIVVLLWRSATAAAPARSEMA